MHRYSERLAWIASQNSFSRLLHEYRSASKLLLDLSISNPTRALADYPHLEIANALGSIRNFFYQPDPLGSLDVRTAVVRRMYERNFAVDLSPASIALTASTSEAYAMLFKLLANPGDEILVPTPSYPLFEYLAQLESVTLKPYKLDYDGSWFIDFGSLEAAATSRSRAIVLVNPNNPTGSFLKTTEFQRLQEFALAHSLPLISDEVFTEYGFAPASERVSTLNGQHNVLSFTLNGLSKSAGMPQLKLAWIAVNGPERERRQACARLELVLDTYLSVGAPVQLAAEALFAVGDGIQKQIRARIQTNFAKLAELLVRQRIHVLHCEGGWSAVLRVPHLLSEEEWIHRLLREHRVVVQPGYFFDMPAGAAYLIVSLLTPEDTFAQGIARVLAVAEQL